MNITIRSATDADSAAIVSLIGAWKSEQSRGTFDELRTSRAVEDSLRTTTSSVLVGELPGRVAGYIVVHWIPFPMIGGTEAYISDLIVDSATRGMGLGTRLMSHVEDMARARGVQRLSLNNRLSAESFVRGFYSKLGFQQRDQFASFVKVLS